MTARWAFAALALAASGASAQQFRWSVPDEVGRVTVPETIWANGMPVRIEARRSKKPAAELWQHFRKDFIDKGLYLTPTADLAKATKEPILAGYDPFKKITYTVMLQENKDGSTTCILGEAHAAEAVGVAGDGAPIFPGAKEVIRTAMEGGAVVTFVSTGTAEEVQRFYRDVYARAGYTESSKGTFTKGVDVVRVRISGKDGELKVALTLRASARDSAPELPK